MILIDTHALIWFMYDDSKLSETALSRIKTEKEAYVSVASLWEIAIKKSLKKIVIDNSMEEMADICRRMNISLLPIKPNHLDYISKLPDIHKDPFDRLIVSQAITENMELVTRDLIIPKYDVKVVW